MKKIAILAAAAAIALTAQPAAAQSSTAQQRLGQILGTLFGDRMGATTSIEAQWAAGRTPLATQRNAFESRVDAEVRSGVLSQTTGATLKTQYYQLVQQEASYGSDGRFTTQERATLAARYNELTEALTTGRYANDDVDATAVVADGRAEFNRRVDAAVVARRITRAQATRLKADYAAVVQLETSYLRDGMISAAERNDLDTRLDALDVRVGDAPASTAPMTSRARLDAIARALPSSGLSAAARAQVLVEHEDLSRLESAYARITETANEEAYLERRISELEVRARVR